MKDRRNPVRNQIDYILTKRDHHRYITDCRSYSGTNTFTDHRLIIAKTNFTFHKTTNRKRTTNLHGSILTEHEHRQTYQDAINSDYTPDNKQTPQSIWSNITETIKTAMNKIKTSNTHGKPQNDDIAFLSKQQHQIRNKINSTTDKYTRDALTKDRNNLMRQIHKLTKQREEPHDDTFHTD